MTNDESNQLYRQAIAMGLTGLLLSRTLESVRTTEGRLQVLREAGEILAELVGDREPPADELDARRQHRQYLQARLIEGRSLGL